MASNVLVEVKNVFKSFQVGTQTIEILKGVSCEINSGDFSIILGPSGCGKSTLLHTILGLEEPSSGDIIFLGENIYANTDEDYRSTFRKKHIGMIYQQPNWIKSMNVSENVAFPLILLGMEKEAAIARAIELLKQVGLENWANYVPTELSGGQQQRIALARGLANNPEIIIADEPTGNLDYQSGQAVMQLLSDLNTKQGKTIIMVTHDLEYLKFAKKAIRLLDGKVLNVYDEKNIEELLHEIKFKRGVSEEPEVDKKEEVPVDTKKVVVKKHTINDQSGLTATIN